MQRLPNLQHIWYFNPWKYMRSFKDTNFKGEGRGSDAGEWWEASEKN
jgi:hypothetical protein